MDAGNLLVKALASLSLVRVLTRAWTRRQRQAGQS